MKNSIKQTAQAGFTLIELIVVIVILGILAATALPKFASLGGDARLAKMQAAQGALSATAAMAHGKALISPTSTTLTVEGTVLTFAGASGYPQADDKVAAAAGLNASDYTVTVNATGTDVAATPATGTPVTPIIPKYSVVITGSSIVGTPTAAKCYVTYTFGKDPTTAAAGDKPTVTVTGTADNCA